MTIDHKLRILHHQAESMFWEHRSMEQKAHDCAVRHWLAWQMLSKCEKPMGFTLEDLEQSVGSVDSLWI